MKWPVSKATIKVLYALHSWTGVIVGITLFVICFSGAIVVFKHEIDLWANPQINIPWPEGSAENNYNIDPLIGPQQALDTFREAYPEKPFLFMRLPHPETSATYAVLLPGRHYVYLNAINGQLLNSNYHEYAQFLRTLHVRLFMGAEGRWLVGVFGLAMLVSIITGVLIHKHIFRDFFKLRLKRSFRLALSDIHKAGGVWALLFHIIIAITGAWIGLIGLINPAAEFFNAPETQISAPKPAPAPMQSLDVLLQRTQQIIPSLQPRALYFDNYGFSDAQITVAGDLPGWVVQSSAAQATFSGVSGALLDVQDFQNTQAATRLFYMMEPLHFGDFGGYGLGGLLLKWLYFILGLSPALISLTGTFIWIDRNTRRKGKQTRGAKEFLPANWLARFSNGVGGGSLIATVVTLPMAILLGITQWRWVEQVAGVNGGQFLFDVFAAHTAGALPLFLAAWLVSGLLLACFKRTAYAWGAVLAICAVLLLMAVGLSLVGTYVLHPASPHSLLVNSSFVLIAGLLLLTAWALSKRQPVHRDRKKHPPRQRLQSKTL